MARLKDDAQWIILLGFIISVSIFFLALVINESVLVGQTTAESVLDLPKSDIRDLRDEVFRSTQIYGELATQTPSIATGDWKTDIIDLSLSRRNSVVAIQDNFAGNIGHPQSGDTVSIHFNNGVTRYYESVFTSEPLSDQAVSSLIAYLVISGILMILIVITMVMVSDTIIERPADQLTYYSFIDIANGISTRIVDIYSIPSDKSSVIIISQYSIPETVAGRDYPVDISPYTGTGKSQEVTVSRGTRSSTVYISGIGASRAAGGSTTGRGINQISSVYP